MTKIPAFFLREHFDNFPKFSIGFVTRYHEDGKNVDACFLYSDDTVSYEIVVPADLIIPIDIYDEKGDFGAVHQA